MESNLVFKNFKLQKSVSTLILVSILVPFLILFAVPKKSNAQWVDAVNAPLQPTQLAEQTTSLGLEIKNLAKDIVKQVFMGIAKKLLNDIAKSTVNWINSGFHGQPLFVENPQSFFKDIAKFETQTFIDQIGYDSLRYPFGRGIALNIISSYKAQFETNAQYTLSKISSDPVFLNNFRTNFNTGGWNGFLINTQYPQNNYIGSQFIADDEIARRIQGTSQNSVQKIKTALDQGQGFLSPQVCRNNDKYNNLVNQFQQPKFDDAKFYDQYLKDHPSPTSQTAEEAEQWNKDRADAYDKAWIAWGDKNYCSDLVDTTPGVVVANQITNVLTSGIRNKELASVIGAPLSAVLDSLISHFMGEGLDKLATKVNPPPPKDDWNYLGNTLGGVTPYGNTTWDSGPDDPVVLDTFKKEVARALNDTAKELNLMAELNKQHDEIWKQTKLLDQCLPGPDLGWEERFDDEVQKSGNKLQEKSVDDDPLEAARARATLRELTYAAGIFKDYVNGQIMKELPNSIDYMEGVDSIKATHDESAELTRQKRERLSAYIRLKSIDGALANIASQPAVGSKEEDTLIKLRKSYYAILGTISHQDSIDNMQSAVDTAVDKLKNLKDMTVECGQERTSIGWNNPDPKDPAWAYGDVTLNRAGAPNDSERVVFCEGPITGGFSHGDNPNTSSGGGTSGITNIILPGTGKSKTPLVIFRSQYNGGKGFLSIPLLNAYHVFNYDTTLGNKWVNIEISCKGVWHATVVDYKDNIPSITVDTGEFPTTNDATNPNDDDSSSTGGGGGSCSADPKNCIWAWVDRGGAPYNGAGGDPEAYIYSIIGKTEGKSASDWEQVLRDSGLPNGPPPGAKADPNVFHGFTQQIGAGGPRGVIFLPTDIPTPPNANGDVYYTHEYLLLRDK